MNEMKLDIGMVKFNRSFALVAAGACLVASGFVGRMVPAEPLSTICMFLTASTSIFPTKIALQSHMEIKKRK